MNVITFIIFLHEFIFYPTDFISSGCLCVFDWLDLHYLLQAVIQLIGALYTVLSKSKEGLDRLAISAIVAGFVSLIIGELGGWPNPIYLFWVSSCLCICFWLPDLYPCCVKGRRHSRASFLKIYMVLSTATILFWIARVAQSNFLLEVRRLIFFPMFITIEHFKK